MERAGHVPGRLHPGGENVRCCAECTSFCRFRGPFGLCFGGRLYERSMSKKGKAPVKHVLSRACGDFEDCREALFRLRDEPWTSPDRSAEPGHGTH